MEKRGLTLSILAIACVTACTSEEIVMVEPSFVAVTPADVSAIEGEQVQLVGAVHDDRRNALVGPALEWSSADSSIASVDAHGLVTARSPGEVAIRARFDDVTGEAKVVVLQGPFVVVVPASLTLYMAPGAAPPQQVVAVSNGGAGTLEQLVTEVAYEGEARGWLRSTLAAPTAPTSFTLRVEQDGVASGRYAATVSVASLARGGSADVDVVVNVAGFQVQQTGGGTSVAESGTTDQISVVLSSQPSAPVVLLAAASDPTEATVSPASLRFTRSDWNRPQSITVRGVDDIDDDADQVSTVSLTVDGAQSPDAYEALPPRTVSVSTVDDDEPPSLVVVESGGSTVVTEGNTTDAFTVALAAPIAANVVLEVTSTTPWEVGVISSMYLTFTPGGWNVPQTVTVIGIDDFFLDGDQWATIVVRVLDVYSDDRYDTLYRNVLVRNVDDEAVGALPPL
ncbi:MAG: Ig-like domain-containing protein [Gemmatimonadales bacterium]